MNSDENSEEIELKGLLIDIKENETFLREIKSKPKNIYIDDNIISKIFFIWNIKSTYIEKSKTPEDYSFDYYSLINSKNVISFVNNDFYFSFFSFYKTILLRNKFNVFITIFLAVLSGILDFLQYMLFQDLLSMVNNHFSDNFQYYLVALKFIIFKLIHNIIQKNLYFYENYLPILISNEIIFLLYQKVISLSDIHSQENLLGKLINLIQTDTENISFIFNYGPSSIISPIQLIFVLWNIYNNYHDFYLIFFLIIILLICFIIAFFIQKMYLKSNTEYLSNKDIRIHSTNEIFTNLKEIKMNGLEKFFENIIDKKRVNELYHYNKIMKQGIANVFLFHNIGVFMTIVLLIYIRTKMKNNNENNNLIQAEIIITIILMFNNLAYPLYRFPVFITGLIDSYVSGKRIIDFLNMKEIQKVFYNYDFDNILDNKYICILGPNGGGKSTFIKD